MKIDYCRGAASLTLRVQNASELNNSHLIYRDAGISREIALTNSPSKVSSVLSNGGFSKVQAGRSLTEVQEQSTQLLIVVSFMFLSNIDSASMLDLQDLARVGGSEIELFDSIGVPPSASM